jgi:hypothetical protein
MTFVPHTFTAEDICKGIDPVEEIRKSVGEEQYAVALVEMTKPLAKKWIRRMEFNRKISESHVRKYRRAMDGGKWFLTNQGVGFNRNGKLVDGQNRLRAFIESQCKHLLIPVAVNLHNKAQATAIDQLNTRKLRDQISITEKRLIDQFEITVANYAWCLSPASLGHRTSIDLDVYVDEYHNRHHKAAMDWVMALYESLPTKKYKTKREPAIFACAMRAYEHAMRDKRASEDEKQRMVVKIGRFVRVALDRADPKMGEGWASKMRVMLDEILSEKLARGMRATITKSGPKYMRRNFYLTVNHTLYKHLNDVACSPTSQIKPSKTEHFPFKEELPGLDERIDLRMKSNSF